MTKSIAPVLLLVFNRPETTARVFEEIRKARPNKLYVAADGPRKERANEKALCEETRRIATAVDWPCKVKTLFRRENLGCGKAVSSAITWFFKNEEMGIIIEDDCLPDPSFFTFCSTLLVKYKNNKKVGSISGGNFQHGGGISVKESYFFSRYPHIWGWASWRRAWSKYDLIMSDWLRIKSNGSKLEELFVSNDEKRVFSKWFDEIHSHPAITWDVQWIFAFWKSKMLSVYPNRNLVVNIGFSGESTHTMESRKFLSQIKLESIHSLIHPSKVERNVAADTFTFNRWFNTKWYMNVMWFLPFWARAFLKKSFGR